VVDAIARLVSSCGFACAGRAAVEMAVDFYAVSDDFASTVLADWSHSVDGAFEAVEYVVHLCRDDLEGLVVFVAADFTPGHGHLRGLLGWT